MVFPQVIAGFRALMDVIGLPMNLLVVMTVALERRFHVMRYILLASLAASDFLFLVLANSFRIASTAQERWLYGQTMCYLNPFFMLYFYLNTVLHLIAVSYERYSAIVKSPMTYDGTITKSRVVLMIFIWVAPIPLSIGPFVGWGQYVYNPEVFTCEQLAVHRDFAAGIIVFFTVLSFVVPFLIILLLNWLVYKTANALQQNVVQVGHLDGSDMSATQLQEMSRSRSERKAAVDVCIIITTFLVCFLPAWIVGICRQLKNLDVPAKLVLGTNAIFHASSICNPIIYSVRKRDFRAGVKTMFRRMGVCRSPNDTSNNEIGMNNFAFRANLSTETSTARPTAPQAIQGYDERFPGSTGRTELTFPRSRLSLIPEITEYD
ncbi:octopamine receptor beta-1R-like [Oculina patagonica]